MSSTSATTTYDDTVPSIVYSGHWSNDSGDVTLHDYFNQTVHTTPVDGNSLTIYWQGNDIALYGAKRSNHGYFSVSIDNGAKTYVDGYAASAVYQTQLFQSTGLPNGTHALTYANENKYSFVDSTRDSTGLDYVVVHGSLYDPNDPPLSTAAASSASPTSSNAGLATVAALQTTSLALGASATAPRVSSALSHTQTTVVLSSSSLDRAASFHFSTFLGILIVVLFNLVL
ncbi:hypothetical protein P7C73_g5103, partial [Tremellales sp. Uapishka_1]